MIELPPDPQPNMNPKLLFYPRDNKGSGFYRMLLPASKLKDMGLAEVKVAMEFKEDLVKWADVVIFQRLDEPEWYNIIEKMKADDKYVVYEIDDLLYGVDPKNESAWQYWNPATLHLGGALKIMSICNAMTTTTDRLAMEYLQVNPKISVLPNYLDKDLWDVPNGWSLEDWNLYYKKKNDDIIRMGWFGSASHQSDLEMVSNIITKICRDNPNVHFTVFGFTPKDVFGMIPLRDTKCSHCGGEGQLEFFDGVPILEYPAKMKSLALDIGIAPITETAFNECKSDLKFKEYSALGIPTVASNIKPYSVSIKNGVTGYLAGSGQEWYNYLELLIKDRGKREEMGKNAYQFYRENTIDKHIHKWLDIYRRIANPKFRW
jgi:O-antigen biosynthesis protein